jgi:hypothetical protein
VGPPPRLALFNPVLIYHEMADDQALSQSTSSGNRKQEIIGPLDLTVKKKSEGSRRAYKAPTGPKMKSRIAKGLEPAPKEQRILSPPDPPKK